MKTFTTLVCLLGPATDAYAHVEDMSEIVHLVDHYPRMCSQTASSPMDC